MAMDYSRFFTERSNARKPSVLREITELGRRASPNTIPLGVGSPNASTFPFECIEVETKDGFGVTFEGSSLSETLQYSECEGLPKLISCLTRIQQAYHDPPLLKEGKLDMMVTAGSQDGIVKSLEMLIKPGDNALAGNITYATFLSWTAAQSVNVLGVEVDSDGLKPESLLQVLSKWSPDDANDPSSNIPKVLYTVPCCDNPTGATTTAERKEKIYELARTYNLIIVEDDPYYYLQFEEPLVPSYQSMDVDGRVIRSDSMSKILAPGLRIGWISGAKPLIKRLVYHQHSSVVQCSTISQRLALILLEHWGLDGFEKHVKAIQQFYKSQQKAMIASAEKWLKGLAEWRAPRGGFYFWLRILNTTDTSQLFYQALEKEVVVVTGKAFSTMKGVPNPYIRLSYSSGSYEQFDLGLKRLSEAVRENLN